MKANDRDKSEKRIEAARQHNEAIDALFVQATYLQICLRDAGVSVELMAHAEEVVQLAFDAGVKAGSSSSGQSARKASDDQMTEVRQFATQEALRWIQEWAQEFGANGRAAPPMSDCINDYKVKGVIKKVGIRNAVIEMASKSESKRVLAFSQNASPRTIASWLKKSSRVVSHFSRIKAK